MAANIYYFKGKAEWVKRDKPDQFGNFTVDLYMEDASWELYEKSGMQNTVREKEGKKFITFRRKAKSIVKGELKDYGPPDLLNKDNEPMTDAVGNGSIVTLKVEVYDAKKGKGSRLDAIRVEELVPYQAKEKFTTEDVVPF